jgi:hypothetical protein
MTKVLCTAALLALVSAASGCVLFLGDDDDVCAYSTPFADLRNPETGQCEAVYGGGWPCGAELDVAVVDWASCWGACEALDEGACLVTPGCRAAYVTADCPPNADCADWQVFHGCWGTAPSGPVQGRCDGLDAYECSRHDDCSAVYEGDRGWDDAVIPSRFSACIPEPGSQGCYSDDECPDGFQCTADTECLPPPGCDPGEACPAVCYGRCVPSQNSCDVIDCGPGFHCEVQCRERPPGCDEWPCEAICVPDGDSCEDGQACPPGHHCETVCVDRPCDDDQPCPGVCWSECVPDVPSGCETVDCPPGFHCEEQCACPPCDGDDPACGMPCECRPACVPDGTTDPGECRGEVWCRSLPPECPDGTVPGILDHCWSGFCIPIAACDPRDPGQCDGEVACDMTAPACPDGTTPGIDDGCYTGYCIPLWACETDRRCAAIDDERTCLSRADCRAVYDGFGCTCEADGTCTCQDWRFARCE